MGFWSWINRVAGLDRPGPAQRFSYDVGPPTPISTMIDLYAGRLGINRQTAMSVSTVLRGRNLMCSIATLPLVQLDSEYRNVRNPLLAQIDPNVPNVVTIAMTVEDLVFDAVSWWRVTARTWDGFPAAARRLDPRTEPVTIEPAHGHTPTSLLPSGVDPNAKVVRVNGEVVPFADLIRFDSPNPGVLVTGSRAIRRSILLDQTSAMYAEDPTAREYFTARDGMDPEDDEVIREFLNDWRSARRTGSTGYVPSTYELHSGNMPSPVDLQLVELQRDAGLAIANEMSVDPEDLGISTNSRTYANAVDRRRDRINDVLSFYMRALTDRLSMPDITRRGYTVEFLLDDYMKANPTERWSVYQTAESMGAMTVEEIRQAEKWAPLPASAATPAAADPDAGDSDGGTVTPLPAGVAARRRAGHRFGTDGADDGLHTFAFEGASGHTFSVDTESRTITGLAVPYGVASGGYLKVRFSKGSLTYADVSRVKHYQDHYKPIGKALELSDTDAGLTAKLSVSKGPAGDELLQLAADGVYDGLSIGVDFSIDPADGDVTLGDDGVYDVTSATLREISTTPMPAFDDARVTKVAASRTPGGKSVTTPTTAPAAPAPAAPAAPPAGQQFTDEQVKQFHDLAKQFGLNVTMPAAPATGPAVVDPTTLSAAPAKVTEPTPYRFDRRGNLTTGSHEFSADLVAAAAGDLAARERCTQFVTAQFTVETTDVGSLNPSTNRPDMYVDQRDFRYPIWDAVSKGTLANITPFFFPKFNSASGLVANHTQGVEPTSGNFTTTNQTVTPSAVSGKVEIMREVWDQGGNPQISNLIWQQMLKGWYEALEAFAVGLLDGVAPTAIALTAGAADDVLVDELTEALALLNFVRGGFSMNNAFTQVDLYKALVAAKATDGRKLLPALNPANADGTARTRWQGLDVNGVAFLPAWALAATGSVVASSYLFDSEAVHAWASAPQKLEFQYQVKSVEIGIWGYKAGAVTDLTGVREITYDPVA
jgi:HK97 family phage prohead protease